MSLHKLPILPDTVLHLKHHSLRMQKIRSRKSNFSIQEIHDRLPLQRKCVAYSPEQKLIASQNIQLLRKLADLKLRPSGIRQIWNQRSFVRKTTSNCGGQIKASQRRIQVQNMRLQRCLTDISNRKKFMVLPQQKHPSQGRSSKRQLKGH